MEKISKRDALIVAGAFLTGAAIQPLYNTLFGDDWRVIKDEVEATRVNTDEPRTTLQYGELEEKYNLRNLRKSVACINMYHRHGHMTSGNTGTLLSNDGYVALCAHQIMDQVDAINIIFVPPIGNSVSFSAEIRFVDGEHDAAILKITDPEFSKKLQRDGIHTFIKPIDRAPNNYKIAGERAVTLGFFDDNLHAVEVTLHSIVDQPAAEYDANNNASIVTGFCNIEGTSTTSAWPGMSGGVLADYNGGFLGILCSTAIDDNCFVPADIVWRLLQIARGQEPAAKSPNLPKQCAIDKRHLIFGTPKI